MNTCPATATHVLWCLAAVADPATGEPVPADLVVGMCPEHRTLITLWAHRHYGHLGEGLVVPAADLHRLQAHLLLDGSTEHLVGNVPGTVAV